MARIEKPGERYGSRQLTAAEQRVIPLLAEGLTNAVIGSRLGWTESVVKNRLRTIYDKLGMDTRLELTLWYVAHHGL